MWGLNLGRGKTLLPFSKTPGAAVGSTLPPLQWVLGFFPEGKVARHEVYHYSAPSSAEIKNELFLHSCSMLHGMDWDNIIFTSDAISEYDNEPYGYKNNKNLTVQLYSMELSSICQTEQSE
jgi:hypothetical protein